jgi:DNA-binding MarR family transcriptional regulator
MNGRAPSVAGSGSAPVASIAPWQAAFLERASALVELTGLPPSHLAVFAWLIVCEPPEQSVADLRAVLGLSAGAISAATATLVRMGLVERVARPGERRLAYRLRPGGWDELLRARLDAATRMRAMAAAALAEAPEPQPRLRELHDLYAWFEARMRELLAGGGPSSGPGVATH